MTETNSWKFPNFDWINVMIVLILGIPILTYFIFIRLVTGLNHLYKDLESLLRSTWIFVQKYDK